MESASLPPTVRKHVHVRGVVQGVGFRPFVYNLARTLGLTGFVFNSSAGVTIEVEGSDVAIHRFLQTLRETPPPLSQIEEVAVSDVAAIGGDTFVIRHSEATDDEFVLVSPDVATCDDCWHDFGDAQNRRYGYAFTNCTNCGPRYTIIQDIPYDRPKTTMSRFVMCDLCRAEYEDPGNRRFHAQPNACAACGPGLRLVERGAGAGKAGDSGGSGSSSESGESGESGDSGEAIIAAARRLLSEGKILAVKGLGGFLLACDAQNDAAVAALRARKRRSEKPFALMMRDIAAVEAMCVVSEPDRKALLSGRRPIVILPRRDDSQLSPEIAPGNSTVGVMLPYTPLHYLLFSDSLDEPSRFPALVMTSGNISDEPIMTSNVEAWERLGAVADWFLFHNRDIYMRVDDSIVRSFAGRERVLRRSRGFVPQPVDLGIEFTELLACGAQLKNTLCLTKGRYAILSQHLGDLENYETLRFFEETLANLKKLFRVAPRAVAHDLHPLYMSTRFALESPIERKIGVQHHHAHIASCMAENHLTGKVIGVAFDGTGYGSDGKIWGGEFLVADFAGFERRGHLRYAPLAGGDAAVRQPWRMGLSYLRDALGNGPLPGHLRFLERVPERERRLVETMIERRLNTVDTSSCGRLFDAVASLIGLRQTISFEGQAAIALEYAAQTGVNARYEFGIESDSTSHPMQLDLRATIRDIVRDLSLSRPTAYISACFHNTVAAAIVEMCIRIRRGEGLNRVCLSGGTFQNVYLLARAVEGLQSAGFEVALHAMVPPNDGGIALGQAVIANELLKREVNS